MRLTEESTDNRFVTTRLEADGAANVIVLFVKQTSALTERARAEIGTTRNDDACGFAYGV